MLDRAEPHETVDLELEAAMAHPMWETQVELERGMLEAGAQDVRDRITIAQSKGQMTRLKPVQGLLDDWLPDVAQGIKDWCSQVSLVRGVKPIALPLLRMADPYVAALIAVRTILDGIADEHVKLPGLAGAIGRTVEHEERIRYWARTEKKLFWAVQREQDRNGATGVHRRRVNINRFNSILKSGETKLKWRGWSQEEHFRVGIALIDIVVRTTGWFEIASDPFHYYRKGSNDSPALVLQPKEGMHEWLGKALSHAEVTQPHFRPTVVPPKQRVGARDGGYWTPFIRTPRLVRFKASQETQKERAADEYDAIDMPDVYDAVNFLQETGYRVNQRVLEVVTECAARNIALGKHDKVLPSGAFVDLPPRTPRMEEHYGELLKAKLSGVPVRDRPRPDEETAREIAAWKRAAAPVWRTNAKRLSRMKGSKRTLEVARIYQNFESIYFPHMLDFRGRGYPIPSGLQPQGNDLARGLLAYDLGCEITSDNDGGTWLAMALSTAYGVDKEDIPYRVAWVQEREALWRAIAQDPLAYLEEWKEADSPVYALAAIFEWVDYLDHGPEGFVSTLPVFVDGTCNGIQHLAAMTRDEKAGYYVNLVPGEKPRDIYKHFAQELQKVLVEDIQVGAIDGDYATFWLELCDGDLPRSLTKRQVMVVPYGGTRESFFDYTREWLDEESPTTGTETEEEAKLRGKRIAYLAGRMWALAPVELPGPMAVMEWIQLCAKAVVEGDQPIFWKTPSGMVVRHFYGKQKGKQVKTMLDGEERWLLLQETTAKLDTKAQLQGISPNFVHSMDAACMVETIKRCKAAGMTHFSSIHDAYGTHAANMWALHRLLREAFVWLHSHDVLADFRNACASVLINQLVANGADPLEAAQIADEKLPQPLPKGNLDVSQVLDSDYFFL